MNRCLISFGANIGSAAETIRQAMESLRSRLGCEPEAFRCSRLFKTPPVGGPAGQPPFVNAVVAADVTLDPWQVWTAVRAVEHEFGRERQRRWEARKIDVDILLYGQERIWTPHLKIPHPRMCMRRFILAPAEDVAADWIDPVAQVSIAAMVERLQTRPASLVVIAGNRQLATKPLEAAARLALAQWRTLPEPSATTATANNAAMRPGAASTPTLSLAASDSRWVGVLDHQQFERLRNNCDLLQSANLLVFLADAMQAEDVAWEDYHRSLALRLGLAITPDGGPNATAQNQPWLVPGPRYLLASDDADWTVHELVAALEAMDCPVEPFSR